MILQVEEVTKRFGGLVALDKVSLNVTESEILGIIGPNGAGKSTLFNVISGYFPADSGKIIFDGQDITGLKAHEIANLGIGRTFQGAASLKKISVLENVFTGYHMRYKTSIWKRLLRSPSARQEEEMLKQRAMEIIDFVGLTPHKDKLAEELSSGYLRLLAVAIALTTKPKLMLLDEPVTTLSGDKVDMVMELVTRVRNLGTTVIIIEHNMKAIMDYCDRIVVLAYGKKLAEGSPHEIRANKEVVESYLGEKD
ncbi:MAG: ABC transporter ATP-binding protein [Dehalococcoidia bacterium]|jgi:branched-chain amino acid transport system ATP-binding protein